MGLLASIKGLFGGDRKAASTDLVKSSSSTTTALTAADDAHRVIIRAAREPRWVYSELDALQSSMTRSLWVYCCASLVASCVATIPPRVTLGGVEVGDDHPLVERLRRPTSQHRWREWQAMRAYHLLLSGTDYVHVLRATALGSSAAHAGAGLPFELWPYAEGEWRTKVETRGAPRVKHFERLVGGRLEVGERDVIRTKLTRPGREGACKGLAPLEGAAREASADDAASEWQRNSYSNRLVPDGAFELSDVDPETGMPWRREQLLEAEEWLLRAWAGAANARAPMVYGSAKWQQMAMTAVEMDFVNSRSASAEGICAAFNVPSVVFRASETTFANLQTARYTLWDSGVLPVAETLFEGLDDELAPEYGPGLSIEPDLSAVDALLPILAARWDVADRELARGVPMSQVSRRHRLGVEPYPGWDVGLIPANLVPSDTYTAGGSLAELDQVEEGVSDG